MSIAWGDFESMAVHYLRELSKRGKEPPVLFVNVKEGTYGVGTFKEFMETKDLMGASPYRMVCTASPDEFMGLLLARFMDFTTEEEDATKKKDISAGEQPSS